MMLEDRIEDHFRKDRTVHIGVFVIVLSLTLFGLFGLYGMDSPTGFSVSILANGTGNSTDNESTSNTPPVLSDIPDQNISAGAAFNEVDLHSYAMDDETSLANLTFAATEEEIIDMSIRDSRYLVANISDDGWSGTEVINVTVIDEAGLEDSDLVSYTVRENQPPTIGVPSRALVNESNMVNITPSASDPEGHTMTITYSSPFDSEGVWQIPQEYTDNMTTVEVTVTATDELGASSETNTTIHVFDVDEPEKVTGPVFEAGRTELNLTISYNEPCYLRMAYRTGEQTSFPDDQVIHDLIDGKNENDVPPYEGYNRLQFVSSRHTLAGVMVFNRSHTLTLDGLSTDTTYYMNLSCLDVVGNIHALPTSKNTAREPSALPRVDTFDGRTTDFETENVSCVPNAILEKTDYGRVEYLETCMDFSGLDVDSFVTLDRGMIQVNTTRAPELEKEANIYFYNLSYDNPGVLRGGDRCKDSMCTITNRFEKDNGTLAVWVKEVTRFSVAEIGELYIEESVENHTAYMGDGITLFAHFFYYGEPYRGPTNECCKLKFTMNGSQKVYNMSYENKSEAYVQTFTIENETAFNYTVECDGSDKGIGSFTEAGRLRILYKSLCGDGFCDINASEGCEDCPEDCGECECVPEWNCSNWTECSDGVQMRECIDLNNCTNVTAPAEEQNCTVEDPCQNGKLDEGEAGIDCGGVCEMPCPNCSDGIKNQGEDDIDCGGPCPDCPTCSDGRKNQKEEEVDCGGPNCYPCENCSDGIKNQGEDGVDCGGPCPDCEPSGGDPEEDPGDGPGDTGDDPRKERPDGGGMSLWMILMIVVGGIVVLGGAGAAVYFNRDMFMGSLPSSTSSSVSPSQPDEGLVHYLQQNMMQNYPPEQLRSVLVEGGWDTQQVDMALKQAHRNIVQQYVAQLEPIISQYDLSNTQVLFGILNTRQYPPEVMKETIKKILRERYPPQVSQKLLPYVN